MAEEQQELPLVAPMQWITREEAEALYPAQSELTPVWGPGFEALEEE